MSKCSKTEHVPRYLVAARSITLSSYYVLTSSVLYQNTYTMTNRIYLFIFFLHLLILTNKISIRICESLGLSPFDLSEKEMERIETALKNIQDSTTKLRSGEMCISPGRKLSSTIFDMTEYLAQSPPPSPSISEPDSPGSSLSSSEPLSGFSRQISDPESSETESENSDVFTENEVSVDNIILVTNCIPPEHNYVINSLNIFKIKTKVAARVVT